MMKTQVLFALALSSLLLLGCQEKDNQAVQATPKSDAEKRAYSVGTRMGKRIKSMADDIREVEGDFSYTMYLQGIEDTVFEKEQLAEEEMEKIAEDFEKGFRLARREKMKAAEEAAKKAEAAFLAENKTKEGVIETDSGLQYKVIREGAPDGAKAGRYDKVVVNYTGKLLNGEVFDSTKESGPAELRILRLIHGWREGLHLMKEGALYELYIPASLGYGKRKVDKIPPNSTLIFEVELIKVIPRENPQDKEQNEDQEK